MKIYISATSRYTYYGSVQDQFGNIRIRDTYFETRANSIAQARNYIVNQAKERLGLLPSAKLLLCKPDDVVEEFEPNPYEETIPNRPRCPDCKTHLTDGGYCPRCYSLGDENPKI